MEVPNSSCEICQSQTELNFLELDKPKNDYIQPLKTAILVCEKCKKEINKHSNFDKAHLNCLRDSMWSSVPTVQVVTYRLLKKLGEQDFLEQMYLEPEILQWAQQEEQKTQQNEIIFKDAYGSILENGDTVTIIKDLDVKGANFVAKRGTAVRNIALTDDIDHIEGKVNGVKIYLKTCFLKKS